MQLTFHTNAHNYDIHMQEMQNDADICIQFQAPNFLSQMTIPVYYYTTRTITKIHPNVTFRNNPKKCAYRYWPLFSMTTATANPHTS